MYDTEAKTYITLLILFSVWFLDLYISLCSVATPSMYWLCGWHHTCTCFLSLPTAGPHLTLMDGLHTSLWLTLFQMRSFLSFVCNSSVVVLWRLCAHLSTAALPPTCSHTYTTHVHSHHCRGGLKQSVGKMPLSEQEPAASIMAFLWSTALHASCVCQESQRTKGWQKTVNMDKA